MSQDGFYALHGLIKPDLAPLSPVIISHDGTTRLLKPIILTGLQGATRLRITDLLQRVAQVHVAWLSNVSEIQQKMDFGFAF